MPSGRVTRSEPGDARHCIGCSRRRATPGRATCRLPTRLSARGRSTSCSCRASPTSSRCACRRRRGSRSVGPGGRGSSRSPARPWPAPTTATSKRFGEPLSVMSVSPFELVEVDAGDDLDGDDRRGHPVDHETERRPPARVRDELAAVLPCVPLPALRRRGPERVEPPGSLPLVGLRVDVEAEHHPALVVLCDMAVRHPHAGVRDVEQDVHRLASADEDGVLPDKVLLRCTVSGTARGSGRRRGCGRGGASDGRSPSR
jgi:hypothetical protein